MQDGVEVLQFAVHVDHTLDRVALTQITERGRGLLDARGLFGADQCRQVLTQHRLDGAAQQVGDVSADVAYREIGLMHDGEHARG